MAVEPLFCRLSGYKLLLSAKMHRAAAEINRHALYAPRHVARYVCVCALADKTARQPASQPAGERPHFIFSVSLR